MFRHQRKQPPVKPSSVVALVGYGTRAQEALAVTNCWLGEIDHGMTPRGKPKRCHCGGWFNPDWFDECKRCRDAYAAALRVVRAIFPGARIIATPGLAYRPGPET